MRLALIAFLLFGACEAPRRGGSLLKPDQFEDIPVPSRATYRTAKEESYSYRSDNFRCGRFSYYYVGSVGDAAAFFRDTMVRPPYNWRLADEDATAEGSRTLVFTKNDERCAVNIDHHRRRSDDDTPAVAIRITLNYDYH